MSNIGQKNLQEKFLSEVTTKKIIVEVNLVNGIVIKGKIVSFDNFSFLLNSNNKEYFFYKHAVTFISSLKK